MRAETWARVPSVDGVWASDLGRVRGDSYSWVAGKGSVRIYNEKPTFGRDAGRGYRRFKYRGIEYQIHRLVACTFHGAEPFVAAVVMHIDDDPNNNRADNLRWGTVSENALAPRCRELRRIATTNQFDPNTVDGAAQRARVSAVFKKYAANFRSTRAGNGGQIDPGTTGS